MRPHSADFAADFVNPLQGDHGRTGFGQLRPPATVLNLGSHWKAVQIDSTHDLAHHVLGAWNAEVKRLSGFQRFFAKALFGGGFMDKANWNDAVMHLETAVRLAPNHVYHRLELAEVYVDLGKYSKAREQLQVIATLPLADVMDPQYKKDAADLLADIKNEKDETSD